MSWPSVKLGSLVIGERSGASLKRDEFADAGIAVVPKKAISDSVDLLENTLVYTSNEKFKLSKGAHVSKKYLITTLRNLNPDGSTLGLICRNNISGDFMLAQGMHAFLFDESVDPDYICYASRQPEFRAEVQRVKVGSTQVHVRARELKEIEIPLPPLPEQKRIAAILDKANAIRRKRQQAIQLADDFLRAVFLDMFGDPVSNPKAWEVRLLKDLSLKIHSGNTPKGGRENYVESGVIFLRSQNVWKRKIILDDVAYIDEAMHKKMAGSSLRNQDILMTKTGRFNTENSSLGRAAMFWGEDDSANVNGHVYLIRLDAKVDKQFVLFILTMPEYYEYIRSVCVGGIDKRQLNKDHLGNFPIIFPSVELQQKFSEIMSMVEGGKIKAVDGLRVSEHMFDALSQKAFAGLL